MKISNKDFDDIRLINYYTGYIIIVIAALMAIPIITSICFEEWNSVLDFGISLNISLIIGLALMITGNVKVKKFEWKHGLIISALSWIILMFISAIPYFLSGHLNSFLDACFDVMSGFTTTGIILTQDLDHLSYGLNMWRHILTFIGGQGMVVLALTFLVKDTTGAYKMYVGEGKDIELLPNVKHTAKLIWMISLVYLIIGTLALWINGLFIGLKPVSSFFHGLFIFMSAWSTGGFSPMSQNMLYYHSFSYELLTIIFFVIGSFNFGLHYSVWQGNRKEIFKNIEIQSFIITVGITTFLLIIGLKKLNIYPNSLALFRKGFYLLISAHTTTGFGTLYARQFALEWGDFGIFILVIAMLIGGSACSTAGGFKGLRVGIVFKSIISDVKKTLTPESKIKIYKYHYIRNQVLDDTIVKSAAFIIICYISLFTIGTALGCYYGYSMASSAFESASITGNVGLSIGISNPSMPWVMKVYYIIAMYLGRLEFISIFALIGFTFGGLKKLCLEYIR